MLLSAIFVYPVRAGGRAGPPVPATAPATEFAPEADCSNAASELSLTMTPLAAQPGAKDLRGVAFVDAVHQQGPQPLHRFAVGTPARRDFFRRAAFRGAALPFPERSADRHGPPPSGAPGNAECPRGRTGCKSWRSAFRKRRCGNQEPDARASRKGGETRISVPASRRGALFSELAARRNGGRAAFRVRPPVSLWTLSQKPFHPRSRRPEKIRHRSVGGAGNASFSRRCLREPAADAPRPMRIRRSPARSATQASAVSVVGRTGRWLDVRFREYPFSRLVP